MNKENMEPVSKESMKRRAIRSFDLVLRILGLALTLVAAVISGVDKETQNITIGLADSLPILQIPVTAKWNYVSSSVYFVVANAIACAYSAATLIVFTWLRSSKRAFGLLICDLIMASLLISADGAMASVGLVAFKGNSHLQWNRVCNLFEAYCDRAAASLIISIFASLVFLWLVVLTILDLHKRST